MSNGQPDPISWHELYDQLVRAGLSKKRATQTADWVIRRGVEGTRQVNLSDKRWLNNQIDGLIDFATLLLRDRRALPGWSEMPPGWRELTEAVVIFLTDARAGSVDRDKARALLERSEQARQWRIRNVGHDDLEIERAQLTHVLTQLERGNHDTGVP